MKHHTESELSNKILERIPSDIRPSDYLAEVLNLSKESIYRRLKGIIPFTFEEILKLSTVLDFSMDELLKGEKNEYAFFNLTTKKLFDTEEDEFIKMFTRHCNNMEAVYKAQNNHIIISANRILSIFANTFDHLIKFYYYKWLHQFGHASLNFKFSDVQIPEKLEEVRHKIKDYSEVQKVTFITDSNIIYNTIKEIKYYIDRGLIEREDVLLIKNDLQNYIEKFFTFSMENVFGKNTQYEVYISSLDIENNTSYTVCDNKISTYYWVYSDIGIYTSDSELCMLQKDWLDSLKKYSILISNSNQKMQAELYNKFLNQLETLTETN
ncbi:MAG: helix-turn-helix domain-containing protein [Dysgonomonas sp.]|nr:helix-turn-helix domain-containing protein [Dysgonomonas sp.]